MIVFRRWFFRAPSFGLLRMMVLWLLLVAVQGASPTWAQRADVSPEQSFAEAMTLYDQHLYPAARASFASFRQRHPTHASVAQALYLEASSALALDHTADAARLFRMLQETYPRHPRARDAQLSLGQYFIEQGRMAEGRTQLQRLVRADASPDQTSRALYLLGEAARAEGDSATALSYFERVARDFPQSDITPAALYAAATTHVRQDQYEAAATAFETLVQDAPNTPYAENVGTALAEVYYELEQYEDVVQDLNPRLPELSGEARARAVFLLAESHHQAKRFGRAQELYRQLIDVYPSNSYRINARYGLAWIDHRLQRYDAAADEFSQVRTAATVSDSLRRAATYQEAVNRSLSGSPEEAVTLYQRILTTWPSSAWTDDARYEMGLLHYDAERYAEAARTLRTLLERHPSFDRTGKAYYWLGNAEMARGNLEAALEAYTAADTRDAVPASVLQEVQFQKAWALYENERYGEAATAFEQLAQEIPNAQRGRDALFWAADSHYQQGDYSRARTLLLRYRNRHPNGRHTAAAQYALGWTYFEQQQYQPAARAFQQFLEGNAPADDTIPYRKDARLRLGDSYFALKRYDDAIAAYESVGGPGGDYALFQAAQALNRADRPRQAIETYQELADLYPDSRWHREALYRVGYLYFQQQDYRRARQTYRDVLERFPSSRAAPQALYGIGDTFYNQGNLQQAASTYQQVLSRYPDAPIATDAASSLFFALDAMGNRDRASAVIDSFATAHPESNMVDELRFRQAETAYQSGSTDEALRLFRQFLRTSTDESLLPEAYYYLGLIYDDRNDAQQAATYLTPLVERFPDSPRHAEAALRLGDIRSGQERYEAARMAYATASESATDPSLRAQARYGQSVALAQLGQPDDAEQLLQQVLEANPSGPLRASAQLGMARIHEQDGRTADALDVYRTVANQSDRETGAEALFRLGRLQQEQGMHRDAIETLERMASLFRGYPEWNARALLTQASAHRALGQTDEAVALYDQVLQKHAGTPFAEQAETRKNAL